MEKTGKLALWVLLSAGIAGCSDSNDLPEPEPAPEPAPLQSHHVAVSGMDIVNIDNGQPVSVAGEAVFGSAQIDD